MGRYTLDDAKEKVHVKLLEARQAEYSVNSAEFRSAWATASTVNRDKLFKTGLTNLEIRDWILEIKCLDIETMPTKNLMGLAAKHKIRNYSRIPRDDLRAILKARLTQ